MKMPLQQQRKNGDKCIAKRNLQQAESKRLMGNRPNKEDAVRNEGKVRHRDRKNQQNERSNRSLHRQDRSNQCRSVKAQICMSQFGNKPTAAIDSAFAESSVRVPRVAVSGEVSTASSKYITLTTRR